MIAWLNRNPYLVLAMAGLALLAGLAVRDLLRERNEPVLTAGQPASVAGVPVRVHVLGAVLTPGVYELSSDGRVEDAIEAAGGMLAGAEPGELNLARRLRDGEQIVVPANEGSSAAFDPGRLLDLNTATLDQLDALPGIGEAYSMRIVASRTVDGPFESVEELLTRDLIPQRTFDAIAALVTVASP